MKRFTDTAIWDKPWFRKLPNRLKSMFRFLCDRCDMAGVMEADWETVSFYVGEPCGPEDLDKFNGNVAMRSGKIFLPQFVAFQYGKLSRECRPHERVFEAMERHGLKEADLFARPAAKAEPTEPAKTSHGNHHPTLEEVKLAAAKTGLPESEAEKFFNYYASKGWLVGKSPMKSWTHALAGWKLRSQSNANGTPAPARSLREMTDEEILNQVVQ